MLEFKKHSGIFLLFLTTAFISFAISAFAEDFYWENPSLITSKDSRFPLVLNGESESYIIYQEVDSKEKVFYLSCRTCHSLTNFSDNLRFAGPYSYSMDEVPEAFTACLDSSGNIALAVMAGSSFIETYFSSDGGKSFAKTQLKTSSIMVAPRIFYSENSGFIIFTSSGKDDAFSIYFASSSDCLSWSNFLEFEPTKNFRNPFLPYLISFEGRDVVAFQCQYTSTATRRISYQIYLTVKNPNGKWSQPLLVTGEDSFTPRVSKEFYSFQNQRPILFKDASRLFLFWERTELSNASICFGDVSSLSGIQDCNVLAESGNSFRAVPFIYNNNLCVTWFDTRHGKEGSYFAMKKGSYWEESAFAVNNYSNQFPGPLILKESDNSDILAFVYQETVNSKTSSKNSIAFLSPDKSVLPPEILPLSYKKGRSSSSQAVRFEIKFPKDSSNIAGYSYSWTKDSDAVPEKVLQKFASSNKLELKASLGGGDYFLSVRIQDYAGNWSEVQNEKYTLDLTPPEPPKITLNNVDSYGFISSNSFRINWEKSPSLDTAGYVYRLDYIGKLPKNICVSKNHPMTLSKNQVLSIKASLEEKYSSSLEKKRKMQSSIQTSFTTSSYCVFCCICLGFPLLCIRITEIFEEAT